MFALLSPLNLLDWEDSVADHGEYKQPFPIFRMIRQIVNSHIFVAQFRILQYICVDITDLFAIEHYQISPALPCPFISELSGSGKMSLFLCLHFYLKTFHSLFITNCFSCVNLSSAHLRRRGLRVAAKSRNMAEWFAAFIILLSLLTGWLPVAFGNSD